MMQRKASSNNQMSQPRTRHLASATAASSCAAAELSVSGLGMLAGWGSSSHDSPAAETQAVVSCVAACVHYPGGRCRGVTEGQDWRSHTWHG